MTRRIAIALTCLAGLLTMPATASADAIAWMYDPDQVVEIRLGGLSEGELDELEIDRDEYVKGTFELLVGGVPKGPQLNDVGVRLKGGHGSESPVKTGKSGFKVRFDEFIDDQLFFGIKRLTLNNMIQDPSMVHETLTYELFHDLGLPASRTGYAFLTLNGENYGLFLNLETLDEISLPQWFGEGNTQHLYEADSPGVDVRPGEAETFEVDEGDDGEGDLGDLEALIDAVDAPGDWSDNVSPHADLEQMAAHWAVERYASHWDGYAGVYEDPLPSGPFRPNNYYLHSDAGGVFQMMPWGTDQTWQFGMEFDEPAGGLMFNECLADAACKQLYLEGLTEVHCVAPGLGLSDRAGGLAAMMSPYQDKEDPAKRKATAEEIAEGVEEVEELTAARPQELEDYLTAEGILGAGTDPCVEPEPEPEAERPLVTSGVQMPPTTEQWVVAAKAGSLGTVARKGKRLRVSVFSPAAGSLKLTARTAGPRAALVCSSRTTIAAGAATRSCRLSRAAVDALEDGPLRLLVSVRLPADPEPLKRQVRLPRF